ncbi:MAG: hypothetical protein IKJ29_07635 [Akkermansia sp.]|nr:hypothetical protein [Akkermansia sp.]
MPGVIYPEEVLHGPRGAVTGSGKAHDKIPRWGVTSRQAAEMLGVTVRSARAILSRSNSKCQLVALPGEVACMYWDRRAVARLVAKRLPLVRKVPEKLCPAREACYILLISRSTLYRYVRRGLLKEYRMRHATETGVRVVTYYLRAEVRKLSARKNAIRARVEGLHKNRLQSEWQEQRGRLQADHHQPNS